MSESLQLVVLGAGGHAKVVLALAVAAGYPIAGICDPALAAAGVSTWRSFPVFGSDEEAALLDPARFALVNGVGQIVDGSLRASLFARFRGLGFGFPVLVHPAAWVAPGTILGEGAQVMAGAVIQPDVFVGANTIVNSRVSVDHDCRVGSEVHLAPGATLCGDVQVGDGAFIGSGATLIPGVRVGPGAVVGAGALVLRDLAAGERLLGAKPQPTTPRR